MQLTKNEIDGLLRLIGLTHDAEIDCDACLADVAEFAERQLAGRSLSAGLRAVERHLALCQECREEYEALGRVLGDLAPGPPGD